MPGASRRSAVDGGQDRQLDECHGHAYSVRLLLLRKTSCPQFLFAVQDLVLPRAGRLQWEDVSAALLKQLQVKCYDFVVNGKCRCRPWYRIPMQLAQQPLADGGLGVVDISAALLARRLSMVRAIRASGDVGAQALELALALALPRPNTGRTHTAASASVQRMLQAAPQCDGVAELYEAAVGDMCVRQLRNGVQPEDMGLWKIILQLPSVNKGKEIWWFAMARCLPSATRLRLPPDQRACVLCDSGAAECTWHWFFDCPAASEVWRRANLRRSRTK